MKEDTLSHPSNIHSFLPSFPQSTNFPQDKLILQPLCSPEWTWDTIMALEMQIEASWGFIGMFILSWYRHCPSCFSLPGMWMQCLVVQQPSCNQGDESHMDGRAERQNKAAFLTTFFSCTCTAYFWTPHSWQKINPWLLGFFFLLHLNEILPDSISNYILISKPFF